MNSQPPGFTLIELLIALSIIAILFGVALPAYSNVIAAAHASDAHSSLLASLMTASHKGALTGRHAVLCPSVDGAACAGASFDWSRGWIVFLDSNGNRERGSDETLIQHAPALDERVHLRSTAGRTRIVFQGNGGNAGSNVTFTLCDARGPAKAQTLVLNNQGRLRAGTPSATAITAACQF